MVCPPQPEISPVSGSMEIDVAPVIFQFSVVDCPADIVVSEAVNEVIFGGVPEVVVTVTEAGAVTDPWLLVAVIV